MSAAKGVCHCKQNYHLDKVRTQVLGQFTTDMLHHLARLFNDISPRQSLVPSMVIVGRSRLTNQAHVVTVENLDYYSVPVNRLTC